MLINKDVLDPILRYGTIWESSLTNGDIRLFFVPLSLPRRSAVRLIQTRGDVFIWKHAEAVINLFPIAISVTSPSAARLEKHPALSRDGSDDIP